MVDDPALKTKIKSLILKGFTKEEIKSLLNQKDDKLIDKCFQESANTHIDDSSIELYSELQKDLSKLVLTEMQNKEKRDPNVILNAVKLQAELQEKKLGLSKSSVRLKLDPSRVSKNFIYERDDEIAELKKQGIPDKEIASKFNISEISILWAMDRVNLNLPEHLKQLSPSLINETRGLNKEERLKILEDAYKNQMTKMQVRELVTNIKNKTGRRRGWDSKPEVVTI